MTGWISLFAIPLVALGSWIFEDDQWLALHQASWAGWGAGVYTALMSSIAAYGLWYRLLQKHPVSRVVPLTLLLSTALLPGRLVLAASLSLGRPVGRCAVAGWSAAVSRARPPQRPHSLLQMPDTYRSAGPKPRSPPHY